MELRFIDTEQELLWKALNQEWNDEDLLSTIGIPSETEIEH